MATTNRNISREQELALIKLLDNTLEAANRLNEILDGMGHQLDAAYQKKAA